MTENKNHKNKLYRKIYIKSSLCLESPIAIGNGINEDTDSDLLLDSSGKSFIPGSSLAGIIKSQLLNKKDLDENILNKLFGKDENLKENINSMIIFYDAFLQENSFNHISIRDGIKINDITKTSIEKSKFNYQVLDTGAKYDFKLEISIREKYKDLSDEIDKIINYIIEIIQSGELRIGAKTSRGYGKVSLEDILIKDFDDMNNLSQIKEYIDFDWNDSEMEELSKWRKKHQKTYEIKTPYTKISISLNIKNTLNIRNYSLNALDVDSEQINIDNRAVIPGTSWSGMFRKRAKEILKEINYNYDSNYMLDNLFGKIGENEETISSRIIFDESMDKQEESKMAYIHRTKIDRFTGGACNKGLFSSKVAVGGDFDLNIMIKDCKNYEISLIILVIKDIMNGLVAIGGETNVGRGIFESDNNIYIDKKLLTEEYEQEINKSLIEEIFYRGNIHGNNKN